MRPPRPDSCTWQLSSMQSTVAANSTEQILISHGLVPNVPHATQTAVHPIRSCRRPSGCLSARSRGRRCDRHRRSAAAPRGRPVRLCGWGGRRVPAAAAAVAACRRRHRSVPTRVASPFPPPPSPLLLACPPVFGYAAARTRRRDNDIVGGDRSRAPGVGYVGAMRVPSGAAACGRACGRARLSGRRRPARGRRRRGGTMNRATAAGAAVQGRQTLCVWHATLPRLPSSSS